MYPSRTGKIVTDAKPFSSDEDERAAPQRRACQTAVHVELLGKKFHELPDQENDLTEYPRTNPDPGLLVIFNQEEFESSRYGRREGTKEDVTELLQCFGRIGFNVQEKYIFYDLERNQVLDKLKKLAKSKDLQNANCFVLAFLTHGESNNTLATKFGDVQIDEIINIFGESEYLRGKPKLFMFQACKGKIATDNAASHNEDSVDAVLVPDNTFNGLVPNDMLIVYSTVEGKVSMRNSFDGTWFIQEFCRNLTGFGRTEDVVSLITRTLKCVANNYYCEVQDDNSPLQVLKQMPVFVSTLSKNFYFTRSKNRNFHLTDLKELKGRVEAMKCLKRKIENSQNSIK